MSGPELANTITAGLIGGIMIIMVAISFAAFVFNGDLAVYLPQAVGLFLFGAALLAVLTAVFGKTPGLIPAIQDAPVTVLAAALASIASSAPASLSGDTLFLTLVTTIIIATTLTGIVFYLLGYFRLGRLIRYVPYPIIGGFLAGTGWLVFLGSLELMTGQSFGWATLGSYFTYDLAISWLPGVALGLTIWFLLRRFSHFLLFPALLLGPAILFYLYLFIAGIPVATALEQGLMIGPFPTGNMWQPYLLTAVSQADFSLILTQNQNFGIIIILATVAFLLNTTGIELVINQDIDFNQELRSVGLFNIVLGLSGSGIGFVTTGFTSLAHRLGGNNRLTTLIVGLLCAIATLLGASLMELIPKFIIGGLIFFIGVSFITEWLIDGRHKVSRAEYGLMLLIIFFIAQVGFLDGIVVGLIAAIILFAYEYSRVDVLRHAELGNHYRSNVWRPRLHQQLLTQKSYWIHIIKLRGYIFFGTADTLLNQIQEILADEANQSLHFVLVDFDLVSGLDASAYHSLIKLKELTAEKELTLLFTGLAPKLQKNLTRTGMVTDETFFFFNELKQGVAWCEDKMLAVFASAGMGLRTRTLRQQLEALVDEPGADANLLDFLQRTDSAGDRLAKMRSLLEREETNGRLDHYFEKQQLPANTVLVEQDQMQKGLYFLEEGRAQIVQQATNKNESVVAIEAGALIGKVNLYSRQERAIATIKTIEPSLVYFLSYDSLAKMEQEEPDIAAVFHRFMAGLLSERLEHTAILTDIVEI
ncbi:MAG: SulP family inorganic anion transporter [Chloroflexota bacterium]